MSVEVAKFFLIAYGKKFVQEKKEISRHLDFGRINSLLEDPEVSLIECEGATTPLKIIKKEKKIETNIILSEKEIKKIIEKFSFGKKITEPVFQGQLENFRITAILSKNLGMRFLIQRINN